jgi:hypothetical protein
MEVNTCDITLGKRETDDNREYFTDSYMGLDQFDHIYQIIAFSGITASARLAYQSKCPFKANIFAEIGDQVGKTLRFSVSNKFQNEKYEQIIFEMFCL